MNEEILLKEYQNLCHDVTKVFVVPLINFQLRETNYLYLLYKRFIEEESSRIHIVSLSVFAHPKIVLSRIKQEKCILHYHWLEITGIQSLTGMIWKLFWISFFKILNGKIIWTVHNEFPHSNNFISLNRSIRKYMARIADKLQVHCESAVDIMIPVLNVRRDKFFTVNHPEYPAKLITRDKAVELLNKNYFDGRISSEDKLFLMFGEIAEYKGIKEVVEIFNNLLDEKKKVIIAGVIKKGNEIYYKKTISLIKNENRVLVCTGRIPDADVPLFLNASDFAVFNYENVLTSGSVLLALNYNKKVIIPFKGCLRELSGQNIVRFNNREELENILLSC